MTSKPWNGDVKKINQSIKARQKRSEKCCSVKVVVADSLVKKVKSWKLSVRYELFVARSFPEAETDDMEPYIKSTLKKKPERIIIHCRTNDLKNKISDRILSLAKSSQQENNIALVSSIVPRKYHLDKKGKHCFGKICNKMN